MSRENDRNENNGNQGSRTESIFIADDNPENLNVLSDILEEAGYGVRASLTGQELLQGVRREEPDLILLDIHMPKMDGYEVCRELKADPETAGIPVVFCSALTETFNIVEAFDVGGVDYITKPFRSREVLARIKTHLDLRQKQRELERSLEYQKAAQRHLVQTEKMTSIGILLAGMAHEINNPVNYIINSLEGLRTDFQEARQILDLCAAPQDGDMTNHREEIQSLLQSLNYPVLIREMDQLFDGIYTGATRVHAIVSSLKAFTVSGEEPKEPLSVNREIERAVLIIRSQLDSSIHLIQEVKPDLTLSAQPGRLSQAVLQLLENSLDAVRSQPQSQRGNPDQITITAQPEEPPADKPQAGIVLTLTDTGSGMTPEAREHALDPFYTTKEVGRGTGLGLTTAQQIIRDLGGGLELDSRPGGGTRITIRLPAA